MKLFLKAFSFLLKKRCGSRVSEAVSETTFDEYVCSRKIANVDERSLIVIYSILDGGEYMFVISEVGFGMIILSLFLCKNEGKECEK